MGACSRLPQRWLSTKARNENWNPQLASGTTPQKLARQCEVILLASQGAPNHAIAQQTGLSRPTVIATRKSFLAGGLEALRQRRKRGRSVLTPELEEKILDTTMKTRPAEGTHWSVRVLPRQLGISRMMVERVWQSHEIQPHGVEKFKSVDEKSQIRALRLGLPERQTHDYKRYGTTMLFAAFNILNGKVIGS